MIDIKGLFQRDDRDNNRYVILNNCNGNIKIPHIEVLEMIIPKRRIYSSVFCWLSLMIGAKKEHCLIKSKNFSVMFSQDNKNIANIGVKAEEVAFFNNIIIPYIASEIFGLESVEYLLCNDDYNRKYLLTFDAKNEGEQFIECKEFFSEKSFEELLKLKNINERIQAMKKFIKDKGFDKKHIKKLEDQCITQLILKKFIEYKDDSLINMSLGYNETKKEARIMPIYDLDYSSGITNPEYEYGEEDNATEADNGKTDLKSVIEQYKDRKGIKEYLELIIKRYDMEKVFKKSKEKTRT